MKCAFVRVGVLTAAICILASASSARPVPRADSRGGGTPHRPTEAGPAVSGLDDGEFLVDTSGTQEEWHPAVASDGANYLVVWSDARSGDYDVYGARVTPQGDVLDPAGIVIARANADQQYPVPAFDGTNYLVVWQDARNGGLDIYGTRVAPEGTVLDPSGIAISTAATDRYPTLAFSGANYLVAWQDYRGGSSYDIYAARVTPQGTVLDDSGVIVSVSASDQVHPAVAFDGTNCLVVWQDFRSPPYRIYGARVTPDGTLVDTGGVAVSNQTADHELPAVAFDGANYLVVWGDTRNSPGENDIYAARVTPGGNVLDTSGIPVSTSTSAQYDSKLSFDGIDYFVVWTDDRGGDDDIYGARVSPLGLVHDESLVVSQTYGQSKPSVCRAGTSLMLVYRGWAGVVDGKTYNVYRIWGKMNPNTGMEESADPTGTRQAPIASIVRSVLFLPASCVERQASGVLLDISGRKVLDLKPGSNDVSRLPPGVYFARSVSGVGRDVSSVGKVIVTR